MEGFKKVRNLLEGHLEGKELLGSVYEHPTVSFKELSLSYIRTVCSLAAREGKGVLWGNNVA